MSTGIDPLSGEAKSEEVFEIAGIVLVSIGVIYGLYAAIFWIWKTFFHGAPQHPLQPLPRQVQMGPVSGAEPSSASRLAELPVHVVSTDTDHEQISDCAICLEDYVRGDQYWELPACRHHFHVVCLRGWLESHTTCPLCRQTV